MTSASDQKLFCEVCSVFNCSFDEFVGEKVVSPSYSSAILAPPCLWKIIKHVLLETQRVKSEEEQCFRSIRLWL